jgi:hypothetical protein
MMDIKNQSRVFVFGFVAVSIALSYASWPMAYGAQVGPPSNSAPATPPPTSNSGETTVPSLQPVDVTHTTDSMNSIGPQPSDDYDALVGLSETRGFPSGEKLKGSEDFLLVIKQNDSDQTTRVSPYVVTLNHGTVLASVRRPSQTGLLHTDVADIAFSANSDSFITFADGLTRIRNVDGMGQALKVKINKGPGTGIAMTIAPGYEIVLADRKLTHDDMHPSDGIARRGSHLLTGGCAAVSEYNVEGALQASALVAKMSASDQSDPKSKRIVADMSRMAAVLNQINGMQGFNDK